MPGSRLKDACCFSQGDGESRQERKVGAGQNQSSQIKLQGQKHCCAAWPWRLESGLLDHLCLGTAPEPGRRLPGRELPLVSKHFLHVQQDDKPVIHLAHPLNNA